jgi:hypothetical protein
VIDSLLAFGRVAIPDEIAMVIIQYLRDWEGDQAAKVDPKDDLYGKYGIVDEDLDDFVIFVAEQIGRRLPEDTSYWPRPLETVEDLARFVLSFPEK